MSTDLDAALATAIRSVVSKHPGHADQRVHGRRGSAAVGGGGGGGGGSLGEDASPYGGGGGSHPYGQEAITRGTGLTGAKYGDKLVANRDIKNVAGEVVIPKGATGTYWSPSLDGVHEIGVDTGGGVHGVKVRAANADGFDYEHKVEGNRELQKLVGDPGPLSPPAKFDQASAETFVIDVASHMQKAGLEPYVTSGYSDSKLGGLETYAGNTQPWKVHDPAAGSPSNEHATTPALKPDQVRMGVEVWGDKGKNKLYEHGRDQDYDQEDGSEDDNSRWDLNSSRVSEMSARIRSTLTKAGLDVVHVTEAGHDAGWGTRNVGFEVVFNRRGVKKSVAESSVRKALELSIRSLVLKHPGHSDQKSHGRRGSGTLASDAFASSVATSVKSPAVFHARGGKAVDPRFLKPLAGHGHGMLNPDVKAGDTVSGKTVGQGPSTIGDSTVIGNQRFTDPLTGLHDTAPGQLGMGVSRQTGKDVGRFGPDIAQMPAGTTTAMGATGTGIAVAAPQPSVVPKGETVVLDDKHFVASDPPIMGQSGDGELASRLASGSTSEMEPIDWNNSGVNGEIGAKAKGTIDGVECQVSLCDEVDGGRGIQAEVASGLVNHAMGGLVDMPGTVIGTGRVVDTNGDEQDTLIGLTEWRTGKKRDYSEVPEHEVIEGAAFDFVTGNSDRHSGNMAVHEGPDGKAHLVAIDQSLSFEQGFGEWNNTKWINDAAGKPLTPKAKTALRAYVADTNAHEAVRSMIASSGYETRDAAKLVSNSVERAKYLLKRGRIPRVKKITNGPWGREEEYISNPAWDMQDWEQL